MKTHPPSDTAVPPLDLTQGLGQTKAAILLLVVLGMIVASALYLLFARGVFEATQRLVLIADDSEGVTVGMNVTFSGFPIGRVQRIELGADGTARIVVDVPVKDANWLRESSVFTMERSLVGATRIRAFTGLLDAPALPDGAERHVLKGDAMAEIPQLVAAIRDLLGNLNHITAQQSPLNQSLRQVQQATETLNGPRGGLGLLMGKDSDRAKLLALLSETQGLVRRLEQVAHHADQQVFGNDGVMRDVQGLVVGARQSLQKIDAVLVEAQGIASNTRSATTDLDVLRAEVEANLRKVDGLLNDVYRRWPFARDAEVTLP